MTPSRAKNAIRSALHELIDRQPSAAQKAQVWAHFNNSCVYCAAALVLADRRGHIDHLVSQADGGGNHVSNRVLACGACNGDEKREEHWQFFLKRKCQDPKTYADRLKRIEDWRAKHQIQPSPIPREMVDAYVLKVCAEFDAACKAIRDASRSVA